MRGPTRFASGVFVACHVVGSPWFVLRSVAPFGVQSGRRCGAGSGRGAWRGCGHPARARRRIRARMRAPGAVAGTWRGRRCGCGHGCGRPARVRRRAPGVGADAGGRARISTSRFRKNHDWYQRDAACGANCLQRRGRRIRRAAFPQVAGMQLLAFPRSRVCSRARFIPYCPLRGLTSIHFVKKEESQGAFSGARSLYFAKCKI